MSTTKVAVHRPIAILNLPKPVPALISAALVTLLEQEKSYVQTVADASPENATSIIQSAHIGVKKTPVHKPRTFAMRIGANPAVASRGALRKPPATATLNRGPRGPLPIEARMDPNRVLYTDAGESVTAKVLLKWMVKAQRRAVLKATGGLHILRHTFCSHLAMKGAPALPIQKLAGHEDLQTTLGYMHLAVGETDRAIRLLEQPHAYVHGTSMGEVPKVS